MLETVIPKKANDFVKVVRSKTHYGEVGKFLEKKKGKNDDVIVVQLLNDLTIEEFDLDSVSHYVGKN